jgi:DNA-binding MarR family transcriptional regulator
MRIDSEFFRQPAFVIDFLHLTARKMNVSKLARHFKTYQGNMAKVISSLEKIKLVKKVEGENKRELRLILTKKGEKIAKSISKIREELISWK